MEVIAESTGVQIYVFESYEKDGKRMYKDEKDTEKTAPNGYYDPLTNSIHIDLYAGNNGEGVMMFTLAHELTHFIRQWSPAKFKVLADFLVQEYGKKGVSLDELVRAQMSKAQNNGRTISYDTAYEEMIADSMETMLSDGAVLRRLKQRDETLWEKIKTRINRIAKKLRYSYKGMDPQTAEGQIVSEMVDAVEKLRELFTEGLVEASENSQTSEQVLASAGIAVDSETDSGSLLSVRDVLNESDRRKVAKALADRFNVTIEEARKWLTAETSLASLILNPKYSMYLDYVGDPGEEAIKANSDYPQGTVDFSNICKKRREFTQVMNRILRNFPNHVFAATDLAKIRTIMGQEGMTLPCGICYVEDRRQMDTIIAQDFIDSLRLYREGSNTRADGKPFNAVQIKALKMVGDDTYTPNIYELVSLEGRNSLKAKNPAMEAAWVKYNNARGMQSARLLTNEAEYKRQILKYNKKTVQSKNDHGGLRIYSFSDAEMFHLIDIVQVITDSATVGLSIQGYTKVNEYAKAVKDTGEKLNRSLIPKGDFGYHMENGKVVLDYDTVEGIDIESPDFFDSKDNPNVGNITIGVSDVQIRAAMVSDFVDMIIPFHTGQSKDVLGEKGIGTWKNYKDFQTEKDLSTGRTSKHQVNIYTEVIQAAEAEGNPIRNKRQFVEKFLQVCKENGLQPRFSQFLNTDSNGDFAYTEGYHKFLVDFKTFAQTETGEYLPQKPVKPIFDDAYITGLLKAYVKEQQTKDAEVAKQMPKVIERITNEIIKPSSAINESVLTEGQTMYSLRKGAEADVNRALTDTHYTEDVYLTESSPSIMVNQKGVRNLPMLMKASHIRENVFTEQEAKKLGLPVDEHTHYHGLGKPLFLEVIDDLDAVTLAYRGTKKASNPSRRENYFILVSQHKDSAGNVINVPVFIDKKGQYNRVFMDTNKIATVFGRDDFFDYIKREVQRGNLVRIKNRSTQASELKATHASSYSKNASNDTTVSQPEGNVNKNSDRDTNPVSTRHLLVNALESAAQTEAERIQLKKYRDNIEKMNEEDALLRDLNRQIKELSFAKGPRDKQKISELRNEAIKVGNRISIYDQRLLRMEASTPLRNVLEREKKAAYQKAKELGNKALDKYKSKASLRWRFGLNRHRLTH